MARLPRLALAGQPLHVILRGNNRQEIFCADDDYRFFLEKLQAASVKHGCDIHSYVLMTNHVHLLATAKTVDGLSKAMQMIGRYYVQYFNHCYRRTGTLWEGRYRATLIDSDAYLLTCMRYIELNPVRANMVAHPSEYPWSSYSANALGHDSVMVAAHPLYRRLGRTDTERQAAYRHLFKHHLGEAMLTAIRDATNKAWALGNERFKQRIASQLDRRVAPSQKGGDRKSEEYRKQSRINRI
jgi:putative transposase